jgi:hypothetical protein
MVEQEIGTISHYFGKLHVAAVDLTQGSLALGDTIHVKGHTSDFTQPVQSLEVDHHAVATVLPGVSAGVSVVDHAREHDHVFKVVP